MPQELHFSFAKIWGNCFVLWYTHSQAVLIFLNQVRNRLIKTLKINWTHSIALIKFNKKFKLQQSREWTIINPTFNNKHLPIITSRHSNKTPIISSPAAIAIPRSPTDLIRQTFPYIKTPRRLPPVMVSQRTPTLNTRNSTNFWTFNSHQ